MAEAVSFVVVGEIEHCWMEEELAKLAWGLIVLGLWVRRRL